MTTCNCKHWSPRANGVPGGRCAIGHLGPTVSYRTCERACEKYDGPEPRLINPPPVPVRLPEPIPEAPPDPSVPILPGSGTGSALAAMLKAMGFEASATCTCRSLAREMDEKGPAWSWASRERIVGVMMDQARARGVNAHPLAAYGLLFLACCRGWLALEPARWGAISGE